MLACVLAAKGALFLAMVSRRKALKALGIGLAGLAACVGLCRGSGYELPGGLLVLSASEAAALRAFALRICAADVPGVPTIDDTHVLGFADTQLAAMDPPLRRDLGRFLLYLEQLAPVACGYAGRFSKLTPDAQDIVLRALERSEQGIFRGAFQSVKALVLMGYYRDDRTFAILGYDGPKVGKP